MDPKKHVFAIFGRISFTDHLIQELHALGFPPPLVFSSLDSEYYRDKRLLEPYNLWGNLEGLAEKGLCHLVKQATVNSEKTLELLKEYGCTIGFSTNCREIIKKPIIDFFDGHIFNIHDSYLPNERGGGLKTWQIINGLNMVGMTIHYLDVGIDSGDIVLRRRKDLPMDRPRPIDYLAGEHNLAKGLLTDFIQMIADSTPIPSLAQDNDSSLYFPRLFTEKNGVIDWNWDVELVERFIRGFSKPYPGAWSYFRDIKVHILDAYPDPDVTQEFHPFCNGKIVTVLDNGTVRVVAGGRALLITQIAVDGKSRKPGDILSCKFSLHSPPGLLEDARLHVPTTKEMNKNEEPTELN